MELGPNFVSTHRWPIVVSVAAIIVIALGGAIIGLTPVLTGGLAIVVVVVAVGTLVWRARNSGQAGGIGAGTVLAHFSIVAVAVLVFIQFYPYGRDHTNPPVTAEPAWSSPRTRELMVNACYDCHSNEVQWPWYADIAPLSWAVTDHVNEGRDAINYSEFVIGADEADETVEEVLDGSMPPRYYTIFGLHPEGNLTEAELAELVAGLRDTPGLSEGEEIESEDEDD